MVTGKLNHDCEKNQNTITGIMDAAKQNDIVVITNCGFSIRLFYDEYEAKPFFIRTYVDDILAIKSIDVLNILKLCLELDDVDGESFQFNVIDSVSLEKTINELQGIKEIVTN